MYIELYNCLFYHLCYHHRHRSIDKDKIKTSYEVKIDFYHFIALIINADDNYGFLN